jgi:hypothetical protein
MTPALLLLTLATSQDYIFTEEQVELYFDEAMRKANGKLFRQIAHPDEVKGVSESACKQFLTKFVTPWLSGPSIQIKGGARITWDSDACDLQIQFRPEGGITYYALNDRSLIFKTSIGLVNGEPKSTTGFSDIIFGIAAEKAIAEPTKIAKMKKAQAWAETAIAATKKLGIKGSINSDTGTWVTWDEVIKESREEVKKAGG